MELEKAKKNLNYYKQILIILDETDTPNDLVEAIEKVLQELDKLQQKEKSRIIGNINTVKTEDLYSVLKPYYIPKKKIEERIEKYKKLSDEFYEKFLESNKLDMEIHDAGISCDAKIQILQELLEEKE